jgi:hypothetical protein
LSSYSCLLLCIERLKGSLRALARSPHAANVRDLALIGGSGGAKSQDVIELARGSLAGLQRLQLTLRSTSPAKTAALLAPPHFPHLDQLSFNILGDGMEQIAAALAAPRPISWRSLRVQAFGMPDASLRELLGSPNMAGLADLALDGVSGRLGTTGTGGTALTETGHITQLCALRLARLLPEDVRGLASAPLLAGVRRLVLRESQMWQPELGQLLWSPHRAPLEVLNLHGNMLVVRQSSIDG